MLQMLKIKVKKKPVNRMLGISRALAAQHGGERFVYWGPNKLDLLCINDVYTYSLIRSTQKCE